MTKTYAFRLRPGDDLKREMQAFVVLNGIEAGWISCCVGSLTNYHIRFADQSNGNKGSGHFEIISLNGTVSVNGSHLHISVSDAEGNVLGGHLLDGCTIYTTAEIILQEADEFVFTRVNDGSTPWMELQIKKK